MLARLRGLADAVAAKIEPRRTRKWVLCPLITAVYVSEGKGIYAAFNCLGLPPRGTTAPRPLTPFLCLVPAYRKNSLRSSG